MYHSLFRCAVCENEAKLVCSSCRSACYCSTECQVRDWKRHKIECNGALICIGNKRPTTDGRRLSDEELDHVLLVSVAKTAEENNDAGLKQLVSHVRKIGVYASPPAPAEDPWSRIRYTLHDDGRGIEVVWSGKSDDVACWYQLALAMMANPALFALDTGLAGFQVQKPKEPDVITHVGVVFKRPEPEIEQRNKQILAQVDIDVNLVRPLHEIPAPGATEDAALLHHYQNVMDLLDQLRNTVEFFAILKGGSDTPPQAEVSSPPRKMQQTGQEDVWMFRTMIEDEEEAIHGAQRPAARIIGRHGAIYLLPDNNGKYEKAWFGLRTAAANWPDDLRAALEIPLLQTSAQEHQPIPPPPLSPNPFTRIRVYDAIDHPNRLVTYCCISRDNERFYCASLHTIECRSTKTGMRLFVADIRTLNNDLTREIERCVYMPQGSGMLVLSRNIIYALDPITGNEIYRNGGGWNVAAFAASVTDKYVGVVSYNTHLVLSGGSLGINIYDHSLRRQQQQQQQPQEQRQLRFVKMHLGRDEFLVRSCAFSPDEKHFVCITHVMDDKNHVFYFHVVDTASMKFVDKFSWDITKIDGPERRDKSNRPVYRYTSVMYCQYSPDGKYFTLVVGSPLFSRKRVLCTINTSTKEVAYTTMSPDPARSQIASEQFCFSQRGDRIVFATSRPSILLINAETGQRISEVMTDNRISHCALSWDGRYLITADEETFRVTIWWAAFFDEYRRKDREAIQRVLAFARRAESSLLRPPPGNIAIDPYLIRSMAEMIRQSRK